MNSFFKSVFSSVHEEEQEGGGAAAASQGSPRGFGELVRTLASTSESAIQACRRDLGEFGTGLLKETAALREAVRDLSFSLGAGDGIAAEGEPAGDARRAKLIKRVISSREEGEGEDLSWEVDDDDDDDDDEEQNGGKQRADQVGDGQEREEEEATPKLDDRILLEGKAEPIVECEDICDVSALSSGQVVPDEDDIGWDEIEDLGDDASSGGSRNMELFKRLSMAAEDEDLSWDFEDDEPNINS